MSDKIAYETLIKYLDPKKSGDHTWFLSLLDDGKQTSYEETHIRAVMQMLRIVHRSESVV